MHGKILENKPCSGAMPFLQILLYSSASAPHRVPPHVAPSSPSTALAPPSASTTVPWYLPTSTLKSPKVLPAHRSYTFSEKRNESVIRTKSPYHATLKGW